ncbi:hypothetical protein [Streptomyces sp. NPDC059224]|uniref:hypothetical protein n=1 Tax=Streptomyces sp. NPDC059224 TaxID=3346775 RepID=UPI00368478AD
MARTSPADWRITAISAWSLTKLAEHLVRQRVVPAVSRETLRRTLREGKISWQTTTTWKSSNDPDFISKMHQVPALCDTPPPDGRVVCVDEFGPLNLMPARERHGDRSDNRAASGPPAIATTACIRSPHST